MKRSLFLIIACLLSVGIATAYPLNVSGNVSLNITDANGTLMFPGGNTSFNASQNVSILQLFNLTVEFPEVLNATLNLSRGEARNLTGYYDNLSLFCANDSYLVFNETWNISQTIKRGETYDATIGACTVHLACSGTCTDPGSYQVDQQVSLVKSGNLFTITSQNNTKTFSMDVFNSSDSITLSYFCPKSIEEVITAENETQMQVAYDFCLAQMPHMNDWLDLSLNQCTNNFNAYRDFVNTHNAQVISANQELSDAKSRVSSLETEVELKNNRINDLEAEVISRDDRLDARDIVISIMAFLLLGELAVIFIVLNMKGEEV